MKQISTKNAEFENEKKKKEKKIKKIRKNPQKTKIWNNNKKKKKKKIANVKW